MIPEYDIHQPRIKLWVRYPAIISGSVPGPSSHGSLVGDESKWCNPNGKAHHLIFRITGVMRIVLLILLHEIGYDEGVS